MFRWKIQMFDVRPLPIREGFLTVSRKVRSWTKFNVCRNSSAIYKVLSMQIENRAALFSLVLISPWFMRQSLSHWLDARPCWN